MSIESDATRLAMLQAVGGLTIKSARGSFVGVFGNDYAGIGEGGLAEVESAAPRITCRSSDVARLKILKGDLVTVEGERYTVVGHQADGSGITELRVEIT
jgi:hypothetical protein